MTIPINLPTGASFITIEGKSNYSFGRNWIDGAENHEQHKQTAVVIGDVFHDRRRSVKSSQLAARLELPDLRSILPYHSSR